MPPFLETLFGKKCVECSDSDIICIQRGLLISPYIKTESGLGPAAPVGETAVYIDGVQLFRTKGISECEVLTGDIKKEEMVKNIQESKNDLINLYISHFLLREESEFLKENDIISQPKDL